jgi:hypothetical protein
VKAARPPDVSDAGWETAVDGLKAFLQAGRGDEARSCGWPDHELYRVPPVWARVDLCGAALLIGDRAVIEITSARIQIRTASGATQCFYRRPKPDFALVYAERLRLLIPDAGEDEAKLRALEFTVSVCRSLFGVDLETAKLVVTAALQERQGK